MNDIRYAIDFLYPREKKPEIALSKELNVDVSLIREIIETGEKPDKINWYLSFRCAAHILWNEYNINRLHFSQDFRKDIERAMSAVQSFNNKNKLKKRGTT